MFFYNNNILYKFCFLFFFIFKKKKLGFKKVQWKVSSFFHSNRIKYFFYFIKKLFLYKKYFFYFFILQNLNHFTHLFTVYYNTFLLKKENFFLNNNFSILEEKGLFTSFSNLYNKKIKNSSFLFLFNFFYTSFFIKIFFFMFKNINVSYFALPTKRNKYTILRSPHIDKKAREQFELRHLFFVINELSMFSFSTNSSLFNIFKFFISNCKIDERLISSYY